MLGNGAGEGCLLIRGLRRQRRGDRRATAGVSRSDWAAAKPIGEMGAWPKRHEEKRDEGGEKRREMGGEGEDVKSCRWKREERVFVLQTWLSGGGWKEGPRTLLRSEILHGPSVTLSAGGRASQTGRLMAARGHPAEAAVAPEEDTAAPHR